MDPVVKTTVAPYPDTPTAPADPDPPSPPPPPVKRASEPKISFMEPPRVPFPPFAEKPPFMCPPGPPPGETIVRDFAFSLLAAFALGAIAASSIAYFSKRSVSDA